MQILNRNVKKEKLMVFDYYDWRGPEETLGDAAVTAIHMHIESLEHTEHGWSAHGTFTSRDHTEECDSKDPWIATGILFETEIQWTVRRKNPLPDELVFRDETGEYLFCLGNRLNARIKTFIANKLTHVVEYIREHPELDHIRIIDEPEHYQGTRHAYIGPCLCKEIGSSNEEHPFDWHAHTNGGQYPAHCFECSCGRHWWRGNPQKELWAIVGDLEAWSMLIEFNGVIVERADLDPYVETPTLVLVRTLRKRGLIPF